MILSKKDINLIRGALRQAYHMSDHYKAFLTSRRLEIPKYRKDGTRAKRDAIRYQCDYCREIFPQSCIDVDHKIPIGRFSELEEIGEFAARMYCSYDNLQILCNECHNEKTRRDRDYSRIIF